MSLFRSPTRALAAAIFLGLTACTQLPKDFEKAVTYALADTSKTRLGQAAKREAANGGGPGESGLHLLTSGMDAFVARSVLADRAQRSIDAQYYILNDDLTGRLFLGQLLKAADRGVRVRLLVDDMGMSLKDPTVAVLDRHPNLEVRLFNPFGRTAPKAAQIVTNFNRVTRRMHNKTFTADSQVSIVGGRNIGDEYFSASSDLNFGDLDTLVIGPAVKDVNASFDSYWNSGLAYPISALHEKAPDPAVVADTKLQLENTINSQEAIKYKEGLRDSALAKKLQSGTLKFHWGNTAVIDDDPTKLLSPRSATELFAAPKLRPYFEQAERELIIISPYFVPTRNGADMLVGLAKRGVKVRILTNSLAATDVAAVHAGYKKYRKELLRNGIELYEIDNTSQGFNRKDIKHMGGSKKASLHAKSFVFDRQKVFIGSFNFDPRAAVENTEVGVVANIPKVAATVAEAFEFLAENSCFQLELTEPRFLTGRQLRWHRTTEEETKVYTKDPNTGFLQRFSVDLIGLLPIEGLL